MCSRHDTEHLAGPRNSRGTPTTNPQAQPRQALPDYMFRQLGAIEAEGMRQWARDHHRPGQAISPLWHPLVRHECALIDAEAEAAWEQRTEQANR